MDQTRLLAEMDHNYDLRSVFVWGGRPQVPEYMVRGGDFYRLVTDPRGSVRLVVDATTGVVVSRIDYDEYGRQLSGTAIDFQPFRFAGGRSPFAGGLLQFGARHYDPEIGRWLSKDPILFGGGDTNLYGYVLSDPVNFVDPSGLTCRYSQSSGQLSCSNASGVYFEGQGHSGNGIGRNNPSQQETPSVGPIPQGRYTVGPPQNRQSAGPVSRHLAPDGPTLAKFPAARNPFSFYLHGGNHSEGCPIINDPGGRSSIPTGEEFIVGP